MPDPAFDALLAIVPDAVVAIDGAHRIVLVNPAAEATFGYAAGEMVGQPVEMLLPEEHADFHAAQVRDWAGAGAPARRMGEGEIQIRGRRKSGELFPAEAWITRVTIDGQERFATVLRDVSAREVMAEAVVDGDARWRRANAELEQFTSLASREIVEPMKAIHGFADRVASRFGERLPSDALFYLDRMRRAASRMQGLVDALLAFTQVTTKGRAFETVSLARIAAEVLNDLKPLTEMHDAVVKVGDLPTIEADPTQMRQLLRNLLANAIDFRRPDARPEVELWAETRGDWCVLAVTDNGTGFDPRHLDHVFDPFARLAESGPFEGAGMGLAICRRIVDRHGGTISAGSERGEGSTFTVWLPVRR